MHPAKHNGSENVFNDIGVIIAIAFCWSFYINKNKKMKDLKYV